MKTTIIIFIFFNYLICSSQTEVISLSNKIGVASYESKDHRSNVYEVVSDRKTINNNQFQGTIIVATDYYPYGSEIGARSFNGDYKYGFQGQEKDDEAKGKGNSINYKYRMHDARVGRFFAVDPLTNKYPYNSSYAFSENTVVNAIELEGLELFTVHGTWQGGQGNSKNFDQNTLNVLGSIYGNTYSNSEFTWVGLSFLFNSRNSQRALAAYYLRDHIVSTRKRLIEEGKISDKEPITIVGYSHGGNVAIQSAEHIEKELGIKVNIITIATPAYNDGSVEDPSKNESILNHLHLYSKGDGVDAIAGAEETYINGKTENLIIPEKDIPHSNYVSTHSAIGNIKKNSKLAVTIKNYLIKKFKVYKSKTSDFPKLEYKPNTDYQLKTDETGAAGHKQ